MNKLKNLFLLLLVSFSLCFSDEIIDNFFSQIKNLKEKSTSIRIETIENKISGEINFSDESYNLIKILFQKIFQKNLPKSLKFDGYMRGKFSPESDKLEFEYLYIYLFTEIDNFVFSQIKNNIQILIPSIGIIKDTKENLEKLQQKKENDSDKNFLPINFIDSMFFYLIEKEYEIKSKIQFIKEGEKEGIKTYVYKYIYPDGIINVEIFDKFYTLSKVEIINEKDKTNLILDYPIPEKEGKIYLYLPNSIKVKSQKDKNTVSLNLTGIKYNKLYGEDDFKIKEMTFPEMMGLIYLKSIK